MRLGTLEAMCDETMNLGSYIEHEDKDEDRIGKHVPLNGTRWKMQRTGSHRTGPDRYRPVGRTEM